MSKSVLIVECLDKEDPGSEGNFLRHMFDLMEVKPTLVAVDSIQDLLQRIAKSKDHVVHVSTHGALRDDDDERFIGWWTPNGNGSKKVLARFEGKFRGKTIVSTACKSGVSGFGRYAVKTLGSRHFIGPSKSPPFCDAILFAHIFYHKLFVSKKGGIKKAFRGYKESYKNPHDFRLYP
jgi:hypothetical protein